MTKRMRRIVEQRIANGDEAADVAKMLHSVLEDMMADAGGEPDDTKSSRAIWSRANRALKAYKVWKDRA